MLIQPHDPDYVPKPMYPEYIPLEDEHVLPTKEHPLPPVVSPTAESPEYVVESDSEEDPEEYEDDEMEDGPVDYPIDGGDDGDDYDGESSGDEADDEDEDKEEEEHFAPVDSAIVIPTNELVSPPKGTYHADISLPPEAEVERLLAMPTPPPSPLASLLPPFCGGTLRLASTQALIDAVTAVIPSPPLPPPLCIPPLVGHRDDIPETEMPPHKRLCLSTLGSRYEIGESSTARLTRGRGIDYGVGNKMHKAFPLPGESSYWQYKFPLPVKVVPTARRLVMPLPEVCTAIEEMMKKLPVETLKEEKDVVDGKLARLLKSSKDLEYIIESQRYDKVKEGVGYNVVPPPAADLYLSPKKNLSWTGLPEFVDDTETPKKSQVKYAEQYMHSNKRPKGNQRN
nr:hypothetical protein [Tanacetum cinerariifolium]